MGADSVADYKEVPHWGAWVLKETGGRGVDVVLETGGAGTLPESLKSVKLGGTVCLVGVLSGTKEPINVLPLIMKAVRVQGAVVGHRAHAEALVQAMMENMARPVVHRSFDWEDVPKAFQELASGHQFGKIAITFPDLDRETP
jgi:NADPH:quinone reductase-like Zn-dependent oxidoreductase